jgi:hypothetical protein
MAKLLTCDRCKKKIGCPHEQFYVEHKSNWRSLWIGDKEYDGPHLCSSCDKKLKKKLKKWLSESKGRGKK